MKADQDEEEIRETLKKNRQIIRSQFNAAANELEDHGRAFVKENIATTLDISVQDIDRKIHEIRLTMKNRSASFREIEALQNDCQKLIREIHSL